jgi:hypothetical protein
MYTISIDTCWARTCFDLFVIHLTYESEMPLLALSFVMAYRWSDELLLCQHEILIDYGSCSHNNENEFGGSHVKILFLTSMDAASAARSLVGTKTCCFRQSELNVSIEWIIKWWPISRKTPNQWRLVFIDKSSFWWRSIILFCIIWLHCRIIVEQVW